MFYKNRYDPSGEMNNIITINLYKNRSNRISARRVQI